MNTKTKKGFTLTELIIVVVIIGILAAVLIPTLTACVKKAKISNDKQLVRNLNLALSTDSLANRDGEKHKNMQEALDAAEIAGYIVDRINATKADNEILWDSENDVFCYLNDGHIEYIPSSVASGDELDDDNPVHAVKLWQIVKLTSGDLKGNKFSVYAAPGSVVAEIETNKGFDAGTLQFPSVSYDRTGEGEDQNGHQVIIRTNSASTTLTINGYVDSNNNTKGDIISHYGSVGSLNIVKCASGSYHENGKVAFAEISTGRIVLESESDIKHIHINSNGNNAFEEVIIKDNGTENLPEAITRDAVQVTAKTEVVTVESNGSSEIVYVYADGTTGKTNKVTEGLNLQNENVNSALGQLVLDNGANPGEKAQTTEQKQAAKTEAVENAQAEEIEGDFWIGVAANSFHGGDGSENNPWIITTAQELALVAKMVNSNNMHGANADNNIYYKNDYYKITSNIYLAAKAWTPIGTKTNMFSGHIFANNGVIINGLTNKDHGGADFNLVLYRSTSGTEGYAGYGFIGYADGCTADNLYFESAEIDVTDSSPTKFSMVGILAGEIKGTCEFSNITINSDSKIISQDKVGGMIGHNSGNLTVTNSTFSGYAEAKNYRCGGFLGQTDTATLSFNGCTFNGVVITPNSNGWAGGFLGHKSAGDNKGNLKNPYIISFVDCNSYSNAESIKASEGNIGSYVGHSTGVVYNFTGSKLNNTSLTTLNETVGCAKQTLRGILGANVYQVYPSGNSDEPIDVVYAFAAGKNQSKNSTTWKQINGLTYTNGKFKICDESVFERDGANNGMKITQIDVINNLATGYKVQLYVSLAGYTDNNTIPFWEIVRWRVVSSETASANASAASAQGYWNTHTENDGKAGQWFDYDAKFIGSGKWNKYYDLTNNVIDNVNVTTSGDYYIVVAQ